MAEVHTKESKKWQPGHVEAEGGSTCGSQMPDCCQRRGCTCLAVHYTAHPNAFPARLTVLLPHTHSRAVQGLWHAESLLFCSKGTH